MRPARAAPNLAFTQPIQIVKLLLAFLFLTAPASAQFINAAAYGEFYCKLRSVGIDRNTARSAAINHAWQQDIPVSSVEEAAAAAAQHVANRCPEYLGN